MKNKINVNINVMLDVIEKCGREEFTTYMFCVWYKDNYLHLPTQYIIAEKLNVSTKTAWRHVNKLIEQGFLSR